MCGSLKFSSEVSKSPIKVGETFPAGTMIRLDRDGSVLPGETIWNGFSRGETLHKWTQEGWLPGTLEVSGFTEGDKEFSIPSGRAIKVLILQKAKNYLSIVTRNAIGDEEKKVHGRFPQTVRK